MLKLIGKEIFTILCSKIVFIQTCVTVCWILLCSTQFTNLIQLVHWLLLVSMVYMYLQAESGKHCGARATKHRIYNDNFVILLSTILLSYGLCYLRTDSTITCQGSPWPNSFGRSFRWQIKHDPVYLSIPKKIQLGDSQEGQWLVGWLVLLLYVPSQQLWSLREGQFT